jgi:hypothetical protein
MYISQVTELSILSRKWLSAHWFEMGTDRVMWLVSSVRTDLLPAAQRAVLKGLCGLVLALPAVQRAQVLQRGRHCRRVNLPNDTI